MTMKMPVFPDFQALMPTCSTPRVAAGCRNRDSSGALH